MVYFALIIPIWVNAPRTTSAEVWTRLSNAGGWSGLPLSVLIGQVSGVFTQVGVDTAAHMSEEVRDAAMAVPRAIISVYIFNFCLIFLAMITLCYHILDVGTAVTDPTAYPVIYVLRQAISQTWLTTILAFTVFLLTFADISYLATVSRDLFAFARDDGLPFSNWISRVDSSRNMPLNACILTCVTSICLALIYLGSPVAFYAFTSLNIVALLQCYNISIGCVLWRRIRHPTTLPKARFSLGKLGIPINIAAIVYSSWAFFWCFWPQYYPITAANFNWSSVIFTSVLLGSLFYYFIWGRWKYVGPVVRVEGRKVR
ncbi:hypothetical protein JDV02_010695 [Purpureocillium takamizusanense]|nr:uncharacterized protein JDV02_010695 [Purpureocillium takamizusanense]UNI24983.1 hypothetical protein JDV02_010695 [Purpureocillium takamizusanense]